MENTAAVLSIGDELMLGQVSERNAPWIANALLPLGLMVREFRTVPDNEAEIARAIVELAAHAGVVVCTGGLGPTDDDLTRQALARALGGVPLCVDEEALSFLEQRFAARGMEMPEINARQALCPRGATLIANRLGTAPGIAASVNGSDVFCLPGPPNEMKAMVEESVLPRLTSGARAAVRTLAIHSCGLSESLAATRLGALMDRSANPLVGTTASAAIVSARVRGWGAGASDAAMDAAAAHIAQAWGPYVFGRGEETLAHSLGRALLDRAEKIAVAESCTGGEIGSFLTSAPGSSQWFVGGVIAYANSVKESALGVPSALIEAHGAVSGEVACAMAHGAAERCGVRFGLSTTGIAGPDGGTPTKPVGTVWIGFVDREVPESAQQGMARAFLIPGGRAEVRRRTTALAVQLARLSILGHGDLPLLWETR